MNLPFGALHELGTEVLWEGQSATMHPSLEFMVSPLSLEVLLRAASHQQLVPSGWV
jgi:hypothetical protein